MNWLVGILAHVDVCVKSMDTRNKKAIDIKQVYNIIRVFSVSFGYLLILSILKLWTFTGAGGSVFWIFVNFKCSKTSNV